MIAKNLKKNTEYFQLANNLDFLHAAQLASKKFLINWYMSIYSLVSGLRSRFLAKSEEVCK